MAFLVALLLLFCGSFGTGLAQSQPPADLTGKNVLILHSYEVNTPVFVRTDSGLSTALQSGGVPSLNQFYESLDLRRNPGPEHRKMLVEQMRMRYGHHRKPDMIVTMYPEALDFVLNDCRTDLPDVPILAIVLPVGFELPETDRRIIAHFARLDILGTLEIAMKMVPGAKRVYVVGGDHRVDRSVEAQARRDLRKWESRLEFVYLSRMPFEEMLAVVSGAPPDSIILSLAFSRDVNGKNYTTPIVNKRLSEVSWAPIFGILDHTLGHGIAGGNLTSFELIGNKAGQLVLDILGGTKTPDELPAVLDVPPVPMFDWRQLRRWNLDEDALPKGSIVINRETTLRDYKYYILGFLAFCILETALIALLLLQRRKKTEAEASLRRKTEELDQFFNVNLDLLCIANAEGYFLRLNPAMERVLGYHCEELMSRPFLDFVHPDDVNKTREALSSLKSQKELLSFENRYRGKDGAYRCLQWNAAPSGDMIYAAARDVTDQMSIESETRKLREDLAHVTRVSTLGELTSSLAHEINQPLAAILSNAQAAQRFLSQDNPDMREISEILGDIIRDDNRAAEVIRKIRALLKKEETRFEALSVNDVAEEILNVVRNDTALAALTIEKVFDSSLPAVWGDRIQLQQVILNLVMNAAEAMRDGSPDRQMLTVKTSKRDERFAEVSVTDTGPGIDGKAGNRLFEPFYTTKSGGLGMGLAISRHIVASHRGEIRAVNNPDRGATVSFTIPFDNGGQRMKEAKPVVFIVDDDPSVRRSLERLLRSVGLAAESFASASQFLQSDRERETGCLVLDVRMPEISGLDLQEKLARAGIFLPIVFISGHSTVPMSVRAMKAGAMDFLQKPFDEQDLLDAVYRAIERCRRDVAQREEIRQIEEKLRSLTPKEHEVFQWVVAGLPNKSIADKLATAEKTIKVHRASIMKKTGAQSVADLVRMADRAGIRPLSGK